MDNPYFSHRHTPEDSPHQEKISVRALERVFEILHFSTLLVALLQLSALSKSFFAIHMFGSGFKTLILPGTMVIASVILNGLFKFSTYTATSVRMFAVLQAACLLSPIALYVLRGIFK